MDWIWPLLVGFLGGGIIGAGIVAKVANPLLDEYIALLKRDIATAEKRIEATRARLVEDRGRDAVQ